MKISFKTLTLVFALLGLLGATNDSFAQKKKKKKKPTTEAVTDAPPVEVAPPAPPAPVSNLVDIKYEVDGYNTLSVRPVHVSDIMYKMSIWRRINFKEKCNEPFFPSGNELSGILMHAVRNGLLQAYEPNNDSVNRTMTKEKFFDAITEKAETGGEPVIDAFTGKPVEVAASAGTEMLPKELYLIELKEDLIFDKQRSRQYYDIQVLNMIIPSDKNLKGVEQPLASFRYKDLDKLFKTLPNAKWYNSANRAEDKKLSDAFDLRLFCSRIVKMSNPKDEPIESMSENAGNVKAGLIASQQSELELVEKENELWDF
jgi:gliding motility associated protien GldN